MKVALNVLSVKPGMGGGLTFALSLAQALGIGKGVNNFTLVGTEANRSIFDRVDATFEPLVRELKHPAARIAAEKFLLPSRLKRLGVDVYVSIDGTLPGLIPCRSVAIFQNLIYFHTRETLLEQPLPLARKLYARTQAYYFRQAWDAAIRKADRCVCVSHALRDEFRREYTPSHGQLEVIYESVDERFRPGEGADLQNPYLLSVGTLYPNKGFRHMIDLLAELRDLEGLRLKIAGPDWGGQKERLTAYACERGVGERLDFLGPVAPDGLVSLYQRALCYGLFSRVEAFPLTIVEALSCGTPIVVADRSGMAELAGELAVRVAPERLDVAGQFVRRLWRDEGFRRERRNISIERSRTFSAGRVATEYWRLFAVLTGQNS